MRPQRTIAREATLTGVGIHTGVAGSVTFKPAPEFAGLVFVRKDLPGEPRVHVRPENAVYDAANGRRTILSENGVEIHTMEHLLATVTGLGLDNLVMETTAMEIVEPEDGSAKPIVDVLRAAGTVDQAVRAPVAIAQASCEILDLVLGPLHLDLLGLVVDLNRVLLTITAESGPGNLLGNLLCAVTHLLDGTPTAGGLAALLNSILALLGQR